MVSLTGDSQDEADAKARALIEDLRGTGHGPAVAVFDTDQVEKQLWQVREGGLGATARAPGMPDTWPGWEDSAVPPDRLGDYLRDLRSALRRVRLRRGCALRALRPGLRAHPNPLRPGHRGGHRGLPVVPGTGRGAGGFLRRLPLGRARRRTGPRELLPIMFGPEMVRAFGTMKTIFDPDNRMNPGKVVQPNPLDGQFRLGTDWTPTSFDTKFSPIPTTTGASTARSHVASGSANAVTTTAA